MHLDRELKVATSAVLEAGEAIMQVYEGQKIKVEVKADASPVTEADRRASRLIAAKLSKAFPEYAILCEEMQDDRSRLGNDWCWIVDPLDGTKEFIKRNGEFTVNIALAYQHKVILGVIYIPVFQELYYATKGGGAYYKPKDGLAEKIKVSNNRNDLVMAVSRSHISKKEALLINKYHINKIIPSGSSIKGCLVARGQADVYYRFGPTMEWDTAAMHCIVEEAGGIFRQMDDSQMYYNRENTLNEKGFYAINLPENKMHL